MAVSPPRPKAPHLNALRAFEAAARHGSFSLAADELSVTPGAVAQHIKTLEAWTGAPLFVRHAQGVRLTDLGRRVADDFTRAFDAVGDAVQSLRAHAAPDHVRIAALPSVAQLWVSPKLPAIRDSMPGVTISVTAQERPPNFKREPYDLGIFFGAFDDDPDTVAVCPDVIFPVCAPSLAQRIASVDDLADQTLLHDLTWRDDWARWLASAGHKAQLTAQQVASGPVFSLYALAVEEARNGAGILIGHGPLVQRHLDSGDLVAPFAHRLELDQPLAIGSARPIDPGSIIDRIVRVLSA